MRLALRSTIQEFFSSIGIIYFFILPVYIPLRTLGIELKSYDNLVTSPAELILYFLQIMLLIAFNSTILSLCYEWVSKRFFSNEQFISHWYKTIAVIYTIIFIASSYFVLNPKNLLNLYAWSGVHYFIISFYQILIRSEINHSQNKAQANNYFGIALNLAGIIALSVFSIFYSSHYLEYYSIYCFCLELGLFVYLVLGRKYYLSVLNIAKQYSFKTIMICVIASTLILLFASITSLIFMLSNCLGALLSLAFVVYFYLKLQFEIDKRDLHLIINVGLGYGLVLAALSSSIMAYLTISYDAFNFAYSSEPIFSVFIGLLFTYFLMGNRINTNRAALTNSIFKLNCAVPAILGIFIIAYFEQAMFLYILIAIFGLYAIVEYLSLFYVRQIAQQENYKEMHGAKLTNFNSVVLNGLCPSLLYIFIFCLTKFTSIKLDQQLLMAISALASFSIIYNISQKYLVKYEI